MPKYSVHIEAGMSVDYEGIDADSMTHAMVIARKEFEDDKDPAKVTITVFNIKKETKDDGL